MMFLVVGKIYFLLTVCRPKMAYNVSGLYEVGVFENRMLNKAPKFNRIPKAKIKHRSPNFIKPLLAVVLIINNLKHTKWKIIDSQQ
jgi:hypothetical protein